VRKPDVDPSCIKIRWPGGLEKDIQVLRVDITSAPGLIIAEIDEEVLGSRVMDGALTISKTRPIIHVSDQVFDAMILQSSIVFW
jgi:hypothetical protein